MFLLCVNRRVVVDVASDLLYVTACMQGRDFIVARWKNQGRAVIGFGQKKWEKDSGVTILYLGESHCKPDLERKLNSVP